MKKLMSKKKGFTLVELLVVVAIIAILMLIALPKFMDATGGARVRVFEANARALISEANTALASAAGNVSDVTVDSLPNVTGENTSKFDGKPADSTYGYKDGVLTCTLQNTKIKGTSGVSNGNYVITYTLGTGKITQTAGVIGAADFTTPD